MGYVRIDWPESQEYMQLTERQMEKYGIELGPDCSFLIPEDNIEEVDALLSGEIEDDDNFIVLYTDEEEGWLDRELYRECVDLTEEDDTDDEAYYEWVRSSKEGMLDDMREALRKNLPNNPVVITGKLGLWNGKREILPEIITDDEEDSNVWVAIRKCMSLSGEVTASVSIDTRDGSLEVEVDHHDGTNVFILRKVAERSYDLVNWLKDEGEDDEHKYESIAYDKFTPEEFEL